MRVTVKPALLLAMALSMGPLASLTSVPAAATTFGCGGAGVTFDDLAGNSIACNGVTFSNFANFSSFGDFGANAPDATEVVVVALISATGQTQLVFSSDDWVVLAGQTMNTSLTYSVLGARPIDEVEGAIGPSEGDVSSNASVFSSTNVSLATILTSTGFPISGFTADARAVLFKHLGQSWSDNLFEWPWRRSSTIFPSLYAGSSARAVDMGDDADGLRRARVCGLSAKQAVSLTAGRSSRASTAPLTLADRFAPGVIQGDLDFGRSPPCNHGPPPGALAARRPGWLSERFSFAIMSLALSQRLRRGL